MNLGSWGDFAFIVTGNIVRTYDEFTRTTEPRWGMHEVMGGKPRAQFGGAGLDGISIIIRLCSSFGIDPVQEAARLRRAADAGMHAPFIRNGKPESQGDWYIESVEEVDLRVGGRGVHFAELTVLLREYY